MIGNYADIMMGYSNGTFNYDSYQAYIIFFVFFIILCFVFTRIKERLSYEAQTNEKIKSIYMSFQFVIV